MISIEAPCDSTQQKGVARIWNVSHGKEIQNFDVGGVRVPSFSSERGVPVFSHNEEMVALLTEQQPQSDSAPFRAALHVFSTQKRLFSINLDLARFGATAAWSTDGNELVITGLKPRQDFSNTGSTPRRIIRISTKNQNVIQTVDMEVVSSGSGDESACGAGFIVFPSSEYAVDCNTIWSAKSGERIASFFPLTNGEWMLMTPEGYYNSSEDAHHYVKMRMGNRVYGAEQLYDHFFRPELVIKRLRGEDISKEGNIPSIQDALAEPPPIVEIISIAGQKNQRVRQVGFTVKGSGGGIGKVSVLHNDKETRETVANMEGSAFFTDSLAIEGAPGPNRVTVRAKNRSNTVRGIMRSERFTVEGMQSVPQVYVLAVGVGKYLSERESLPYAASDAKRVAESFQHVLGTLYSNDQIHVDILTDEEATRDAVNKRLKKLEEVVRPEDHLVLFYAGHGFLEDQLYLSTYEFTGRFDFNTSISSGKLLEAYRRIKALDQLLILDTCHAGAIDRTLEEIYESRMSVLTRGMGMHVFAASMPLQKAIEGYDNKSGIFTHALLEAMDAGADADSDGDGIVTVKEVGRFVKRRTAEIARKYGETQSPVVLDVGRDTELYRAPVRH